MPADRLHHRGDSQPVAHPIRTRVWGIGAVLLLTVALAVTFGVFFLTAMRMANKAREVRVPDVRGHSLAESTALLSTLGLGVKVEARLPDSTVPIDHVLAQDPAPGTVFRRQRSVRIRVSEGQRDPVVPSVVGQAERMADIVLAQQQIQVGEHATVYSSRFPADTVVAQDPAPELHASKVALLVNRSSVGVTFVMPDLIGTPSARVVEILRRRGFRVTVSAEVPYAGLAPGVVVRQSPQAGFQVSYGDTVSIEVTR
jgi:beta-lactam-binding protein with PASTA domain